MKTLILGEVIDNKLSTGTLEIETKANESVSYKHLKLQTKRIV